MDHKYFELTPSDFEASYHSTQSSSAHTTSEQSESNYEESPNQYDSFRSSLEGSYDNGNRRRDPYSWTTSETESDNGNPFFPSYKLSSDTPLPTPSSVYYTAQTHFSSSNESESNKPPWEFDFSVLDKNYGMSRSSTLELEPDLKPLNYQPREEFREDDSIPCTQSTNIRYGEYLASLNDQSYENKSYGQYDSEYD